MGHLLIFMPPSTKSITDDDQAAVAATWCLLLWYFRLIWRAADLTHRPDRLGPICGKDFVWVMQVVQMVCKCGENSTDAVQLAVIRALLTVATAEHFIVHGDCLMQAVSRC